MRRRVKRAHCADCERYRDIIAALEQELAHHQPEIEHARTCRLYLYHQPYGAPATPEDLWWQGAS